MIGRWWNRYWFDESSLLRLAIFRIVAFSMALGTKGVVTWQLEDYAAAAARGETRPWNPLYLFEVFPLPMPTPEASTLLFWCLTISAVCAILGIATRLSTAVAALLFLYYWAFAYSIGQAHHEKIALIFSLLVLPFSPCGARLSVDALFARLRRAAAGGDATDPLVDKSPWALWPLRFIQITAVFGYTFAGWTKLAISGLKWTNGYSLQYIMLGSGTPWAPFMTQNLELTRWMSIGLLFVQSTFFLVLFVPKLRWFYLPMGILFHLLAMKTIGTGPYDTFWMLLVCFIPTETLPSVFSRLFKQGHALKRIAVAAIVLVPVLAYLQLVRPRYLPPEFLLLLIPAAAAIIALFDGLRLELRYDPDCRRSRMLTTAACALDWGGRLSACPSAGKAFCVVSPSGSESRGAAAFLQLILRAPALVVLALPLALVSSAAPRSA